MSGLPSRQPLGRYGWSPRWNAVGQHLSNGPAFYDVHLQLLQAGADGLPGEGVFPRQPYGIAYGDTRREVLVQLDDDLVERLDALAANLGTNRSELMRRGAQAILEAEDLATTDRALLLAYRRQPADPALVASARRLAARTAPSW